MEVGYRAGEQIMLAMDPAVTGCSETAWRA